MYCGILSLLPCDKFFLSIHNLYWAFGAKVFPTVITVLLVYFAKKNDKWKKKYYLYIFVAMLFSLCHTYEFVSMVMVLCMIPLIFYWEENRITERVKVVIISGMICVGAFFVSLGIWFVQCARYYGNVKEAIDKIWYIVASRSGLNAIEGEHLSELGKSLSVADVISKFLYGEGSNLGGSFKAIHIISVLILICLIRTVITYFKKKYQFNKSLNLFLLLSAFASVSWMIISKGHAYHHTHITGVLWFYCLIPALGCAAGRAIQEIIWLMFDMARRRGTQQ